MDGIISLSLDFRVSWMIALAQWHVSRQESTGLQQVCADRLVLSACPLMSLPSPREEP